MRHEESVYIEIAEHLTIKWVEKGYPQTLSVLSEESDGATPYLSVRPKPKDDSAFQQPDGWSDLVIPEVHFWDGTSLCIVRGYPIEYEAVEICKDADPGLLAGHNIAVIGLEMLDQWIDRGLYPCCETYYGEGDWTGKVYAHDDHGLRPSVWLTLKEEYMGSVKYEPRAYDLRFVGQFSRIKEGE